MPLGNHQATDSRGGEITTVVLKSTNPYLPDRVEFRHQFVKFKAGRGIDIKISYQTVNKRDFLKIINLYSAHRSKKKERAKPRNAQKDA